MFWKTKFWDVDHISWKYNVVTIVAMCSLENESHYFRNSSFIHLPHRNYTLPLRFYYFTLTEMILTIARCYWPCWHHWAIERSWWWPMVSVVSKSLHPDTTTTLPPCLETWSYWWVSSSQSCVIIISSSLARLLCSWVSWWWWQTQPR